MRLHTYSTRLEGGEGLFSGTNIDHCAKRLLVSGRAGSFGMFSKTSSKSVTKMSSASLSSVSLSSVTEDFGIKKQNFKDEAEKSKYLHRFQGELYPKHISRRMLITSCIMSAAGIQAYIYQCYILCICVILVVGISINFWRKPTRGIRRNVDIINSISVSSYHMVYALFTIDLETACCYVCLVLSGLVLYFCSKMAAKKGLLHLDSLFHCSMHLYGTIVNCWFYPKVYEFHSKAILAAINR